MQEIYKKSEKNRQPGVDDFLLLCYNNKSYGYNSLKGVLKNEPEFFIIRAAWHKNR